MIESKAFRLLLVVFVSLPVLGTSITSDSGEITVSSAVEQWGPAVMHDATGTTILWTESAAAPQIWWGHVDENGVRAAEHILSPSGSAQGYADIAPGATDGLAVWWEQSRNRIRAALITSAGETRGLPFDLGNGFSPRVAWNGRDWLVVWMSTSEGGVFRFIMYSLVTEGGSVARPGGTPITFTRGARTDPDVTWNGREFLVIYNELGPSLSVVRGIRFSAGGTPVGEVQILLEPYAGPASAAWNGKEYLVVSNSLYSGMAAHVDASLNASPAFSLGLPRVANVEVRALDDGLFAVVAANGSDSRLVLVGAGGPTANIALPFAANGLDVVADGNRLCIGYVRTDTGPTQRVFLRVIGLDVGGLRRRAAR